MVKPKPQLPSFTISIADGLVTWQAVPNAISYELFVGEISQGIIDGLSYQIDPVALNLQYGTHVIEVVAKAEAYLDSK